MTRTKLAERMAEFLGLRGNERDVMFDDLAPSQKSAIFIKYFFSPDGFFAVWDKLIEMKLDIAFDFFNSLLILKNIPRTNEIPDRIIIFPFFIIL